jgi:polar amino acid transport system substrate-binding protein
MSASRRRCLLSCLLFAVLPAWAAQAPCPPLTRIGLSDVGFSSVRTEKGFEGIAVDVFQEVARRTGCQIEFVWYPRGRLFVELEAGKVDLAPGSVRSAARDGFAHFIPYTYTQFDLVLSKRVAGRYNSLADFVARGKGKLNITRGVPHGPQMEALIAILERQGRLEVVSDYETVFNKINAARADGALATPTIYLEHLRRLHMEDGVSIVPLPESPPQFVGVYASNKTIDGETFALFAKTIRAIVLERLVVGYYGKYFDEAKVRQIFRPGLPAIASAIDEGG